MTVETTSLGLVSSDPWAGPQEPALEEARQPTEPDPVEPTPPRRQTIEGSRRRTLLVFAAALVLIVAATWFSNAESVEQIADVGALGIRSEAALSAAAVAQNRVAQAALIAEANTLGVAADDEVERALASATFATTELDRRLSLVVDELEGDPLLILQLGGQFEGAIEDVLAQISDGDIDDTQSSLVAVDSGFGALAAELTDVRDGAFSDVAVARDSAGQVALGARILVAFLLPMLMIFAYRFATVRAGKRRDLQQRLDDERSMLEAKDELIANISHELRTPLTGILGFSQEAALDETLEVEDLRSMAAVVAGEANELSRMVDDLITTARDQEDALTLVMDTMDPREELGAVLVPAQIAGREIDVELQPGQIRGDRLRVRQIIRNLVSNALKYGGPNVAVIGNVRGSAYRLMVVDDGDGVSEDLEERLFTRFVHRGQAPILSGSVGLGLAIARRLAEVMGGSLTYERKGGMTAFTLEMPLAGQEPMAS